MKRASGCSTGTRDVIAPEGSALHAEAHCYEWTYLYATADPAMMDGKSKVSDEVTHRGIVLNALPLNILCKHRKDSKATSHSYH